MLVSKKHLKQLMYAAPVYSSTNSIQKLFQGGLPVLYNHLFWLNVQLLCKIEFNNEEQYLANSSIL